MEKENFKSQHYDMFDWDNVLSTNTVVKIPALAYSDKSSSSTSSNSSSEHPTFESLFGSIFPSLGVPSPDEVCEKPVETKPPPTKDTKEPPKPGCPLQKQSAGTKRPQWAGVKPKWVKTAQAIMKKRNTQHGKGKGRKSRSGKLNSKSSAASDGPRTSVTDFLTPDTSTNGDESSTGQENIDEAAPYEEEVDDDDEGKGEECFNIMDVMQ